MSAGALIFTRQARRLRAQEDARAPRSQPLDEVDFGGEVVLVDAELVIAEVPRWFAGVLELGADSFKEAVRGGVKFTNQQKAVSLHSNLDHDLVVAQSVATLS